MVHWAVAGALLAGASAPVAAAPFPFGNTQVSIVARDEPIAQFMRGLFGRLGRPVVISPAVTGQVNGNFSGDARQVFERVARAFNIAAYYDGATVYLYAASEVGARTYPASPTGARRAVRAIGELGLPDARNQVRLTSGGMLMATGSPRFLDQVGEIARMQASMPDPPASAYVPPLPRSSGGPATAAAAPETLEFRVFYLRYARAEDTVLTSGGQELRIPGVASTLRSLVLDGQDQGSGVSARPLRQTVNRLGGRGLAAVAPAVGQLSAEPQTNFYGQYDQFANEQRAVTADSFAGGPPASPVRIQAAPNLNAVIVRDAPERMAAYSGLIRALDVEPQVIEIEATIIDVDTERLKELGIDFSVLTTGVNFRSNTLDAASGAANLTGILGKAGEFIASIRALQNRDAARIVARPQVLTISNVEAVFDRTQTFYVRVQGFQAVDLFNVSVGTVLRVNPHVFRDQNQTRIRIGLGIEDGQLTNQVVDAIPVIERSQLTTQALLVEGESLLVGGLTVDAEERRRGRVPVLGDIPLLGNAFRNSRTRVSRTERLFLITPRVTSVGRRTPNRVGAPMPAPGARETPLLPPPAPPMPTAPGPSGTPVPPPTTGVSR